MTKQVQLKRYYGTTPTFTGALAELTVDTDTMSLVLHDGNTGGIPRKQDYVVDQITISMGMMAAMGW